MKADAAGSIDLLRSLKTFAATVELANFSAAGRQLGITPGAVSKQVGMLEARVGCRLFQRSTRHLSVTEQGRRLYAMVLQPTQQIEAAIATLSADETQLSGPVKVSLPIAFSRVALLPVLGRFRERFPQIELDLRFENRRVDLISEGYDCAIGQLKDTDSSVVARTLAPLTLILCAAPAYLERQGTPASVKELEHHEVISFRSPNSGRIQIWKFQVRNREVVFQPHSQLVVTDTEALTELAVAGCGIALLGAHHAAPLIDAGRLKHVLPGCAERRSDICIYYPARRHLPPRVSAFVEFVVTQVRDSETVKRAMAIGRRRRLAPQAGTQAGG
ncbi:LysR family transcriptional regulator [Paraburkholderia sp. MMS20-SJTN17]|uniref:LysR family transcriptional regulator n=1 Tax=Paraburkholderia translucens TaxID=2886945 RepID=A0ABS8K789_9BURK|nr:LysR family transcriptional regulator [Paraburkholderia sp. MMS20-SJTN17]MCC8400610.1 LysR family transcriptional regulator [Paraburkholderia sp. MMS20-SJTN17]